MRTTIAIIAGDALERVEPFIRTDVENISGRVFYYHGEGSAAMPRSLEGHGQLASNFRLGLYELLKRAKLTQLSPRETALARSFKSLKVDVALAEFGPTGVCVLPACRKLGLPLIVHFRGFDAYERNILRRYGEDYRELFAYAFKIMVVSREMRGQLIHLGCPEEKLVVNSSTPQVIFYDVKPDYDSKQVIAVGAFREKKAPFYVILSFHKVLQSVPDARLVMVGDGPLLGVCECLCRFYGMSSQVEFAGRLNSGQIAERLSRCRIFVQHSIQARNQDREGTPTAIMEAGAAGLPVVSTRHAGITEAVLDGDTGYLVDEHDVDGMADCLIRLLHDPGLAQRLGERGREHIRQNHGAEKHFSTLDNLISEAITAKKL